MVGIGNNGENKIRTVGLEVLEVKLKNLPSEIMDPGGQENYNYNNCCKMDRTASK